MLNAVLQETEKLTKESISPLVAEYLRTGSKATLAEIQNRPLEFRWKRWAWMPVQRALPHPEDCDEIDKRFVQMCGLMLPDLVEDWAEWLLLNETAEKPVLPNLFVYLTETLGITDDKAREIVLEGVKTIRLEVDKPVSSLATWLLGLDDGVLLQYLGNFKAYSVPQGLMGHLLRANSKRAMYVVKWVLQNDQHAFRMGSNLMKYAPDVYRPLVEECYQHTNNYYHKFGWGAALAADNPARRDEIKKVAIEAYKSNGGHSEIEWLCQTYGAGIVPDLIRILEEGETRPHMPLINFSVRGLGAAAEPVMVAAVQKAARAGARSALEILISSHISSQRPLIEQTVRTKLQEEDSDEVIYHLKFVRNLGREKFSAQLWPLLDHKSKQVRDLAVPLLAGVPESEREALARFKTKKAFTRLAAVQILVLLDTPTAKKALMGVVENESDDSVRDEALKALGQGGSLSWAEIEKWIKRAEPKLGKPVLDWFEDRHQPVIKLKDGKELSGPKVRYLLYRQSRVKEIVPDVEASALYDLIEPVSGADFACELLKAYLDSELDAKDRWIFAVAGRLGDGRSLRLLTKSIPDWAEHSRTKLAEYAVQGIGLMKHEEALLTLDAYSIRYRSKFKNLGAAAAAAFALAAENFGISVDELGDRIVPWLGFTAGEPRIQESGKKRVELRISPQLQLEMIDLEKNKPLKSPPAEFKAEISELKASLKEAVKSQVLRMENQMVRQRRWAAPRFRELYLKHPLLVPFAQSLVWGTYGKDGKLEQTFRALPDLSLTTVEDESFALPEKVEIGIVHPLEVEEKQRQTWIKHLADYEVVMPFEQMTRPVVLVQESERALKFSERYSGTSVVGVTFKSRAERRGWVRGSVIDAGGIIAYRKEFPGAGVEAFIGLEGMYIGIDVESSIELKDLCFVKAGSVKIGSYEYDEPSKTDDPRLMAFGDVPPIPFSEVMTDLDKISGKQTTETE